MKIIKSIKFTDDEIKAIKNFAEIFDGVSKECTFSCSKCGFRWVCCCEGNEADLIENMAILVENDEDGEEEGYDC